MAVFGRLYLYPPYLLCLYLTCSHRYFQPAYISKRKTQSHSFNLNPVRGSTQIYNKRDKDSDIIFFNFFFNFSIDIAYLRVLFYITMLYIAMLYSISTILLYYYSHTCKLLYYYTTILYSLVNTIVPLGDFTLYHQHIYILLLYC